MHIFEASTHVAADPPSVLAVLMDASNFEVWESGLMHISGEVRSNASVVLADRDGHRRRRFTVQVLPAASMTWKHQGLPGLFQASRHFTVSRQRDGTNLSVRDVFAGSLAQFLAGCIPLCVSNKDLSEYVHAAGARAELLERSCFGRYPPDHGLS